MDSDPKIPHYTQPWDTTLYVSSSLGWAVAGIMVLLPSMYNVIVHMLAIVGFFTVATSSNTRQVGAEFQRGVSQAVIQRVSSFVATASAAATAASSSAAPTPERAPNITTT
jgi:hypothetical protein